MRMKFKNNSCFNCGTRSHGNESDSRKNVPYEM